MKVKIAGQISIVVSGFCFLFIFIGSCGDLLINLDVFFNGYQPERDYNCFFFPQAYKSMVIAFPFLMMIFYIVWTKFGNKRNEAEQIEYENLLQIKREEQVELKRQFENKSFPHEN